MNETSRKNWIDATKLLAILIVLINHSGLRLPLVNFWGGMFFVPVFFVLSGYTYRRSLQPIPNVIKKKAKRLLLPYLMANLFLFLFFYVKDFILGTRQMKEALPALLGILYARNQWVGVHTSLFHVSTLPEQSLLMTILNSPTWFLPALFLTLIVYEVINKKTKGEEKKILLAVLILLVISLIYHYVSPILLPWSLDAIPEFLCMFVFGRWLRKKNILVKGYLRYKTKLKHRLGIILLLILFGYSVKINQSVNYSIHQMNTSVLLALYNALMSSAIIMLLMRCLDDYTPKWIAKMGKHTLTILCYHMFVFAVLDIVLGSIIKLELSALWVQALKVCLTFILFGILGVLSDILSKAAPYRKGGIHET